MGTLLQMKADIATVARFGPHPGFVAPTAKLPCLCTFSVGDLQNHCPGLGKKMEPSQDLMLLGCQVAAWKDAQARHCDAPCMMSLTESSYTYVYIYI